MHYACYSNDVLDLAVHGGLLMDGSGWPGVPNPGVGVRDGRIMAVGLTPELPAREVIDATGLIVAPGFVDMHAHSELAVVGAAPRYAAKRHQGITLEVHGQDGLSYAPFPDAETAGAICRQIEAWNGPHTSGPVSVGDYLAALRGRLFANIAYLVPHGNIRIAIAGYDARPLLDDELARLRDAVAEGMEQGAVGASFGLTYAPASAADDREVRAVAESVARFGGYLSPHLRSYGRGAMAAYCEFIALALSTGVRVHLTHANLNHAENRGRADELLAMIGAARDKGAQITLDSYPYTAGATYLAAFLPTWAAGEFTRSGVAAFSDQQRSAICTELEDTGSDGAHGVPIDWTLLQLSSAPGSPYAQDAGRCIADIAAARGRTPFEVYWDVLATAGLRAGALNFAGDEANVRTMLASPWHAVGTDAILVGDRPHPRGWGAIPRFLGHYVRDERLVPLHEAVRKLTSLPASIIGAHDRGLIREGNAADLVCFDLERVDARATYAEPMTAPVGITNVVINGCQVVGNGDVIDAPRPGAVVVRV